MSSLPADLETRLRAAAPGGCAFRSDTNAKGVGTAWCELAGPADLAAVAALLKEMGARLSTISALQPRPPEAEDEDDEAEKKAPEPPPVTLSGLPVDGKTYEILYHFDLDGSTLSLIVFLPADAGQVASITPLFRNADWPERELMEIYNLRIVGHPDPRRLFLDESIEPAVLERLIPFSTLVNAASTKSLWEKIIESKEAES
jgi:NADH:ubiquinone oxidoreductase subunit C